MKIKKICVILLMSILISNLTISCLAVTETTGDINNSKITKEQLNEKLQELKENDSEIEKIVTGDNVIEITTSEEKYEMKYEIEDNDVIFSINVEVKQGMKWEEYARCFGHDGISGGNIEKCLAMGYFAVANILNGDNNTTKMYYALTKIDKLKGKYAKSDSWGIYTPGDEGVETTINSGEKILNTKDFENRTMEYFNSIYKDNIYTYDDSKECNTYKWVTEKKNQTETSCILEEKIIINTEDDFSKIKEYAEQIKNSFNNNTSDTTNSNQTSTSQGDDSLENNTNDVTNKEDQKANISVMPKTGKETNTFLDALYILIALTIIGIFSLIIIRKKE